MKNPPFLLRQYWLLAAFAGILTSRHWPLACTCLLLVPLLAWRRIVAPGRRFALLFLAGLLLCFGAGAGYAAWRAKPLPTQPEWLRAAASPTAQHLKLEHYLESLKTGPTTLWEASDNRFPDDSAGTKRDGAYRNGLRLAAKVLEVEARDDRNLRLTLGDIRPVDTAVHADAEAWPGRLVFTWNLPLTPEGARPSPPGRSGYAYPRTEEAETARPEPLATRPLPGQELELTLRLRDIRSLRNQGLWETESYWADRGVSLRAWDFAWRPKLVFPQGLEGVSAATQWREDWRQRVLAALPHERGADGYLAEGAGLIPALLFGDKYLLDSQDTELFSRSTLAHSLALSGLHLGYAAALGYFAVALLYRAFPQLALRLPRRKAAVLGGTLPALGYLWLGGAPPSLLRSALMLFFVGWMLFRQRPLVLADALLWAVALILLWDPAALFDLRLQLSALCIAALAWAQPLLTRVSSQSVANGGRGHAPAHTWRSGRFRRALRLLLLLSSLVIQIILAPLLVGSFGILGLALPLNALWLPLLGLLVMPCCFLGLLTSILHLPTLAGIFFQLAALPCGWLLELLRWLDGAGALPVLVPPQAHWLSILGYWLALACLPPLFQTLRQGRISRDLWLKLTLALLLLSGPGLLQLYENSREGVRLRLLDVGQAQAVLLEWQERRLLLDGGGSGSGSRFDVGREVISATLSRGRQPRLDYLLASHLDQDHTQGLLFPLRHLRVDYYADNGEEPKTSLGEELLTLVQKQGLERRSLVAGASLDLGGGLMAEVLHPAEKPGPGPKEGNRNSLVLRFVWRGQGLALACGDVGAEAQRAILRRLAQNGGSLKAEVLILPHHGSAGSLLPEFYAAVAPKLALASTGYGNTWNFPAPKLKNTLLEMHIPLLSTARCGQIQVFWANEQAQPTVNSARWGELQLE